MGAEYLAVVYGLASALSWGAGDFSGGMASRRTSVYFVILLSQTVGALIMLLAALGLAEAVPAWTSLTVAALAGICGVIGLIALYKGLAGGTMSVVAPITAAVAAAVPVLVALLLEGWPSAWQMLGFGLALVAVWLLAQDGAGQRIELRSLSLPLIAGAGFGFFFVFIDLASTEAVFLPLLAARLASLVLVAVVVLRHRHESKPSTSQIPLILLAGLFDTGGNVFFVLAAQAGRLDISAVLSSLYPATTVILAAFILKESISQRQRAGLLAALAALALIAL
ncbi:MAG: EamA family transporter [Chloroflexi bacterium]|nr:EamA family transporter [Chloroflexota bacterium]